MVKIIKFKGRFNIACFCCIIIRLAEQRLDLKLSLPSPDAPLLPFKYTSDHDDQPFDDRIPPQIMSPSSISCDRRPASYIIFGPSVGSSSMKLPPHEQAGPHPRNWAHWLPYSPEKHAGMVSAPISWPAALDSAPASISPIMNHVTKSLGLLNPQAGDRSSLLPKMKKTPTSLSVKKRPLKASTSNVLQQKCKKKGKSVHGFTYNPTRLSNDMQPMETGLEENVHSHEPHDHHRLQSQGIQPLETTREENSYSKEPHSDNSTLESPGMMLITATREGSSRSQSSDSSLPEAFKLIERMKKEIAGSRSSDYYCPRRRKSVPCLASYINRKFSFQGEKEVGRRQSVMAQVFDISVTLADDLLFQYGFFHGPASSQHPYLSEPFLHLALPESAPSNACCRGEESARKYLRRMNKSVITYTLLSIHLIRSSRQSWEHHGPVVAVGNDKLIHVILQDFHSFYQDIIPHRKDANELSSSASWTAKLKLFVEGKDTHFLFAQNPHAATKKIGSRFSHF
ncbi:hypothetical protein PCASD_14814 [Puccinia coronata f. sp. avenae]|uniref:Uncharacterized protein n=1 Tax=Puccinia coronata f. sp. avenae TaxID=200324 RepID=A0A2N5TCP6_9BASI|nr:hypothetical protein PCASD_14814 [Puccinia coronata f. sp. avenae]